MSQESQELRDFCNNCDRRCCSRPVILPHERDNIIVKTKMGILKRRRVFSKRDGFYIVNGDPCPFLKDGACSLEEIKPLNCRIFPLALTHQGKEAEWDVSPECPACNKLSYEFIDQAKRLGQPLLDKHRENGPLI